jgi:hypothetical protein
MKRGLVGFPDKGKGALGAGGETSRGSTLPKKTVTSETSSSSSATFHQSSGNAFSLHLPAALLDRKELAGALSSLGFRITASTLATKATRGGGPKYQPWGRRRVLYLWSDAVAWAEGRLGSARENSSIGWKAKAGDQHEGSTDER